MKTQSYFKLIPALFIIFLLMFGKTSLGEQEVPRGDGVIIHLADLAVVYKIKTNSVTLESNGTVLSGEKEWSAVKVSPGVYHIKNKRWQNFLWLIDTNNGVEPNDGLAAEVAGRELGTEQGGFPDYLSGISVKTRGKKGQDPQEIRLTFNPGTMLYDLNTKRFLITGANTVLSYGEDWDREEVSYMVFQFRRKDWKKIYWEFDYVKGQYQKKTGVFGSRRGVTGKKSIALGPDSNIIGLHPPDFIFDKSMPYTSVVPDEKSTYISGFVKKQPLAPPQPIARPTQVSPAPPQPVTNSSAPRPVPLELYGAPTPGARGPYIVDQGFANWHNNIPESEWIAKEKALYRNILKQGSYDVMVVPLQVQVYAFDRVNRSLITRRLAAKIGRETDLRVADPTLVARALGERSRRFNDLDIYKLADELKVKYLVRMYAGHNLDENLMLTVFFQERDGNGSLWANTEKKHFNWNGVSFSDSAPPAEVFRTIEADVFAKLRLPGVKAGVKEAVYKKEKDIKVPENFLTISSVQTASPVLKAYYLQFLGVLYPNDYEDEHIEREHLFERSIIALDAISPKSPDYPLIKARAYFYLGSRPAALSSLGDPKTPEEKALYAFINANQPEMEKWTKQITSPLHRLISEIELNDLRFDYNMNSDETATAERIKSLAKKYEGWEVPILRRLVSKDVWGYLPNIFVKKMLDDAYPAPGLDAEGFVRSKQALGKSLDWDSELERKIYRHYRKVLEEKGPMLWANAWSGPGEADYFDLLYYSAEANLWKQFKIVISAQGLYKRGLDLLGDYEPLYGGNLRFMNLNAQALEYLSNKAESQQAESLRKDAREIRRKQCYWSQGESPISGCFTENFYDADYPRQEWTSNARDRRMLKNSSVFNGKPPASPGNYCEQLEHNLLYTHVDFRNIRFYYRYLVEQKMYKEAEKLLALNKDRFVGNPLRTEFLAELTKKNNDYDGLEKFYRQAIADAPDNFANYHGLGEFYLFSGEVKKAFEAYKSYPHFYDTNVNQIALSHYAGDTGLLFYSAGAIDEARYFLKLAAGYGTGSEAEMVSAGYYALSEGDYAGAAMHFLREADRYGRDTAYMLYMSVLHVTGHQKDAWAVLNGMNKPESALTAMLVGSRMEGMSLEEQNKKLLMENQHIRNLEHVQDYFILAGILDRSPERRISTVLKEAYLKLNPRADKSAEYFSLQTKFADAYYLLRTKDYKGAYQLLEGLNKTGDARLLPYFAMAGAMSGNVAKVESSLKEIQDKKRRVFYYNLSKAIILGTQNKHAEALKYFDSARNSAPSVVEGYPVMPWYSLVEACEWLYGETGYAGYKDLALEYAKIYQRMMPIMAWAYAVEAKYTTNGKDKLRALAMTLYLDKESERISGFPEAEKKKALEWLKGNNPFLGSPESPKPNQRTDVF